MLAQAALRHKCMWVDLAAGKARTSTEDWKMPGVDREEKVMVLALYCSAGSLPIKLLMMLVFAVPGPPTSKVACKI